MVAVAVAVIIVVLVGLLFLGVAGIAGALRLWSTATTSRRPVLRRVLAGVVVAVATYLLLLGVGVWLNPI